MQLAQRIENLPPYLFANIDSMLTRAREKGVDVISFGIGDPDLATPDFILQRMHEEIEKKENHQYPSYRGSGEYRKAIARWYEKRHGVKLDPEREILALIGSKEGIAHLPFCFINPGDEALFPDPSYPVYRTATLLAGGHPIPFPLRREEDFQPRPGDISSRLTPQSRIIFLNYPNNPTGAIARPERMAEILEIARANNLLVAYDGAYNEIVFDDQKPFSILELKESREVALEFGSFSKTFNMTGWRLAWAAGSSAAIEALGRFKTNVDSGAFTAIQMAGKEGLESGEEFIAGLKNRYQDRRDLVCQGLESLGWPVDKCGGSFFLWLRVPTPENSSTFCQRLFQDTGVFMTPGNSYGEEGEGYLRLSLTVNEDRIEEALGRIKDAGYAF